MNESALIFLSAFENRLSVTPSKQMQPLSRIKTLDGLRVPGISPVGNQRVM